MTSDPEVERLLTLLRRAMQVLGITHRELARRLAVNPSYLSRLFNGVIELKVEHLLKLVQAIGLRPGEFLRIAYPDNAEPPSKAAQMLRELFQEVVPAAPLAPWAPPPPPPQPVVMTREQVEQMVVDTVRRLFSGFASLQKSD
jgi:transcriptional regulator with XRE-family HTH domain